MKEDWIFVTLILWVLFLSIFHLLSFFLCSFNLPILCSNLINEKEKKEKHKTYLKNKITKNKERIWALQNLSETKLRISFQLNYYKMLLTKKSTNPMFYAFYVYKVWHLPKHLEFPLKFLKYKERHLDQVYKYF